MPSQERLSDPRMLLLRKLSFAYLGNSLKQSAELMYNDSLGRIKFFQLWLSLATFFSLVVLGMFFVLIYRPAIVQLDKEIKRSEHNMAYMVLFVALLHGAS